MKLCTTDKVKLTQTHVAVWYVGLRYNWSRYSMTLACTFGSYIKNVQYIDVQLPLFANINLCTYIAWQRVSC